MQKKILLCKSLINAYTNAMNGFLDSADKPERGIRIRYSFLFLFIFLWLEWIEWVGMETRRVKGRTEKRIGERRNVYSAGSIDEFGRWAFVADYGPRIWITKSLLTEAKSEVSLRVDDSTCPFTLSFASFLWKNFAFEARPPTNRIWL